jgi:cyclophilin family peptidyl-prolyl cis-trans isomerase
MKSGSRVAAVVAVLTLTAACGGSDPRVSLYTSAGDIVIGLCPEQAPLTVENFLAYVGEAHYDGLVFHRVMQGFMIQAGGYGAELAPREPTRPPVRNESRNGVANLRGTIAMARTGAPHSAQAQFFINHADNPALDYEGQGPATWGYAVFGRVLEGLSVVDAIAATPSRAVSPAFQNFPLQPIFIDSIRVLGSWQAGACLPEGPREPPSSGSRDR